ncbi:MAG: HEPN domain-containing protein [Thermodesulfovibrionales bacterium]|nr:HEPN domain-containing protein [Thermodesulfovibrionales bacterium]MDP3111727.1 HEPN domain-containing protein [Thermodesulfovibrionales bacterium]
MKKRPDVLEWVIKAEQDYQTAEVMARKRKVPVPDVVGFHSQQCIEKYFKALLVLKKQDFPKTHDLIELLDIAVKKDPLLDIHRQDLRILNPFSVQFRYPGESATLEESKKALKAMRRVRKYFKERFSF